MTEFVRNIAETANFIVLDRYDPAWSVSTGYQSEDAMERELIKELVDQGYEYRTDITSPALMLANVRGHLQRLNGVTFLEGEWLRFVQEYLDPAVDTFVDKARKVHKDHVKDFTFDDGHVKNIQLFDKEHSVRNKLEVIKQFEQTGTHDNRYDVTLLVNGLPLVQIELKRRGVAIREAFNQINRYTKESFNAKNSLYKFVQIFVISNGTDTRYFANCKDPGKNSFDFTMNWARSDNTPIKDIKDFTATFLQKRTLLDILFKYSVFDARERLLILRPYQVAAVERILWKIHSTNLSGQWSKTESGGYIWHTTGSGKTLTSFKAAQLATQLDFVEKVFFVVDRKDLDYQTMKEYKKFSPDSVNGSSNTAGLKKNIESNDNKIIVTTIQKLNNLMKAEKDLSIYGKNVVFIFDECHRSQFGEAQKNLKSRFKKFCQFGFTGTPIFPENAQGTETTATVFGRELHSYVITDAIRDEKVLKFKVDYHSVDPKFKKDEGEDDAKISNAEIQQALMHPERINEITSWILKNFKHKTGRLHDASAGFNAIFAVSSIEAAIAYYRSFKRLQDGHERKLRVATIFSFAANEEQNAIGMIPDESFDVEDAPQSAKEALTTAINDYNAEFKTSFGVDSDGFQNYYRDLAKRVQAREVDLLIVVGMFLTGFDAPRLNTIFVDKSLRYHGLIQAFSRTNRIFDTTKKFGNIVCFRDLEQATIDAITLFGDKNTRNIVLEKSYADYMYGSKNAEHRGFVTIARDLNAQFPDPQSIVTEEDKKKFVKLFGEYLRSENILRNYDEFVILKELGAADLSDSDAIDSIQCDHHLSDDELQELIGQLQDLSEIGALNERKAQDYRSVYNDIRDWLREEGAANAAGKAQLDWDDIVFEVELLKSQEINLDFILGLILDKSLGQKSKEGIIEEIRRIIRASIGTRAKEGLIVSFITQLDISKVNDKAGIIDDFFRFAQAEKAREAEALIAEFGLNMEPAKRYLNTSIEKEFASDEGSDLLNILPKMNRLDRRYKTIKEDVFERISRFVEVFKGVGGKI